jgi:hypothetical protein
LNWELRRTAQTQSVTCPNKPPQILKSCAQDFGGTMHMWTPDAALVNSPSLTFEEVQVVVDEAHRLGLKVARHTYGGEGMASCINAAWMLPDTSSNSIGMGSGSYCKKSFRLWPHGMI